MTEVLACAQQTLLTYLLEVLIVDDAEKNLFLCVINKSTAGAICIPDWTWNCSNCSRDIKSLLRGKTVNSFPKTQKITKVKKVFQLLQKNNKTTTTILLRQHHYGNTIFQSSVSPWTTLGPLAIVVSISLCQEVAADIKRHRSDKATNKAPCIVLRRKEDEDRIGRNGTLLGGQDVEVRICGSLGVARSPSPKRGRLFWKSLSIAAGTESSCWEWSYSILQGESNRVCGCLLWD